MFVRIIEYYIHIYSLSANITKWSGSMEDQRADKNIGVSSSNW